MSEDRRVPAETLLMLDQVLEARRTGTALFTVKEGRVLTWTFLAWRVPP